MVILIIIINIIATVVQTCLNHWYISMGLFLFHIQNRVSFIALELCYAHRNWIGPKHYWWKIMRVVGSIYRTHHWATWTTYSGQGTYGRTQIIFLTGSHQIISKRYSCGNNVTIGSRRLWCIWSYIFRIHLTDRLPVSESNNSGFCPRPPSAQMGIVVGHCVRSTGRLSVRPPVYPSVRPERHYRSNSLRISALSLKFGGMIAVQNGHARPIFCVPW